MRALLSLAVAAAVYASGAPAFAQTPWPASFFNPSAQDGDILLPMPCGAQMAFRAVRTPVANEPLADRRLTLGQAGERATPREPNARDFIEFDRAEHLVGAFREGGARDPYYVLGKYEVTVDQYRAVVEATCSAPTREGMRPRTAIGWFDAVAFAHRYSEWLLSNAEARAALRARWRQGDEVPFVRLPTEAEWEYAARGGVETPAEDFRGLRFPMDGPIANFVVIGPQLTRPQPIGGRSPNPLGLHDMLGNVEEIMLEPFRLNRGERLHGRAGGFIVRGGSFETPETSLRTAMRFERRHFHPETGAAIREPTVGLRLALGLAVLEGHQQEERLQAEWRAMMDSAGRRPSDPMQPARPIDPNAQPETLLNRLIAATVRADLRRSLERIRQSLNDERAAARSASLARQEIERRMIQTVIGAAAVIIRTIQDNQIQADNANSVLQDRGHSGRATPQYCARPSAEQRFECDMRARREVFEDNLEKAWRQYADLLLASARDFSADILEAQLRVWQSERANQDYRTLRRYAACFVEQAADHQRRRPADLGPYRRGIVAGALLSECVNTR